jgi:hypothetical protein
MKIIRLFATVLTAGFFSACATQPVAYNSTKDEGQWEAKAQIKNLQSGKADTISLDVISVKDQALRMEVSGTLGVHVASFLMKESDVSYSVHTQKKYYSGAVSEKSLRPLLRADIDPRWLYSIFFDSPLKGWTCVGEPIEKCQRSDGTKVQWSERNGEKKRITISNQQFELQVLVKSFTTKVQSPDKAFSLDAPESYKRYKLQ